jgi:F-type H+-transporting ATPase subunit alpha
VGGDAQIRAMRQVAGTMKTDLAQYRSLAAFAQFASDLDAATKRQIDRGARLTEILKQPQYQPMTVEKQVASIWGATNGGLDSVTVEDVSSWEEQWLSYLENSTPQILAAIRDDKRITDETKELLQRALKDFSDTVSLGSGSRQPVAVA